MTGAVLPILMNMQMQSSSTGGPLPDPRSKEYCMHLYTHPDMYVVMPPSSPPVAPGEAMRQALVIHRVSVQARFVGVEEAEEMTRGKAKVRTTSTTATTISNFRH